MKVIIIISYRQYLEAIKMEFQMIEIYDANLYDWMNLIKTVNDIGLQLFTKKVK